MQLPFSEQQFFEIIRAYNQSVWPAQVILTVMSLCMVAGLILRRPWATRAIFAGLAALWMWIAVAYHLVFFTTINPAAYLFAGLFALGGSVFLWFAIRRSNVTFAISSGARPAMGFALLSYALLIYPLWSSLSGHPYPELPTFGLPCPTTIFTIGMLAFVRGERTWVLFVAPVIWSLVGLQAAFLFGVYPDLGLGVAAVAAVTLALRPLRGFQHPTPKLV